MYGGKSRAHLGKNIFGRFRKITNHDNPISKKKPMPAGAPIQNATPIPAIPLSLSTKLNPNRAKQTNVAVRVGNPLLIADIQFWVGPASDAAEVRRYSCLRTDRLTIPLMIAP